MPSPERPLRFGQWGENLVLSFLSAGTKENKLPPPEVIVWARSIQKLVYTH